jgi:hypothetical protein
MMKASESDAAGGENLNIDFEGRNMEEVSHYPRII